MSEEKTPGRAVLAVWRQRLSEDNGLDLTTWDRLDEADRQMLEDAGQAAIDAFLAGDSVSAGDIREALAMWQRQNAEAVLAEPDALDDLDAPAPDYRALLDKSTAAHWNAALPGEQKIANAHRREGGLEEL